MGDGSSTLPILNIQSERSGEATALGVGPTVSVTNQELDQRTEETRVNDDDDMRQTVEHTARTHYSAAACIER